MKRSFILVNDILERIEWKKGFVTFSFLCVVASPIQAFNQIEYSLSQQTKCVTTTIIQSDISQAPIGENSCVSLFCNNTYNVTDMLDEAFDNLVARVPSASDANETFCLIRKGLGNILAEKVSVRYDVTSKVLNVAFRLPDDMLLSVMKPLETMDDSYVMFNLYHLRELLISDTAEVNFLSQYIRNAEQKAAQIS